MLIVLILFLCFKRPAHPWLVLINLPFSLIGSILVIGISGIGLSLGALVGLVTVFGVGARNSILLLAHYEHLIDNEGALWNDQTVVRGASERLVPILMTATVTALGLAPLAFGMNQPGQEIEGPMAITVLGGLLTSTLLNLLVLPALAKRFSYRTKREKSRKGTVRSARDGRQCRRMNGCTDAIKEWLTRTSPSPCPSRPAGAEIGSHAALLTKEDPDQAIRVSRAASSGSGQIRGSRA
jgi:predicted RND superfamily exporter protein